MILPRHPFLADGGERMAAELALLAMYALVLGGLAALILVVGIHVIGGAL